MSTHCHIRLPTAEGNWSSTTMLHSSHIAAYCQWDALAPEAYPSHHPPGIMPWLKCCLKYDQCFAACGSSAPSTDGMAVKDTPLTRAALLAQLAATPTEFCLDT
ncbi:unnamed protein product [Arctogadus glacialis]